MDLMELVPVLSWKDSPAKAVELKGQYDRFLAERLQRVLASDGEVDRTYAAFDQETRRRLLHEPFVLQSLNTPDLDVAAAKRVLIATMLAALDAPARLDVARVTDGREPSAAGMNVSSTPLLSLPPRSRTERPLQPPSDDVRAQVIEMTRGSLGFVGSVAPSASRFVSMFIELLFIGDQEVPPSPIPGKQWNQCLSGSFERMPGITYIANGQTAYDLKIADALVHEAVHGLLIMFESVHKPLLRDRVKGVRLESPWSGNRLPVLFYVHACFVCYALASFWRRAVLDDRHPRSGVMMEWALSGFRRAPVTGVHRATLESQADPEVFRCLETIERLVLEEDWPAVPATPTAAVAMAPSPS